MEMVSSSDQLDPKSHFSFHDILHFLQMSEFPEHILHNKNKKRALRKCANKFVLKGKVLYYVGRKRERRRMVVMDEDEKRNILMSVHGAGHFGQKKTILKLEADYYWLGMISDVKNLIASCGVCRNKGSRRVAMPSMKLLKASGPWEVLGLDVLGPLPVTSRANRYLLLLIDYFSKWAEAVPLIEKSQEHVASALTVVFCRYGFPRKVFSSLGKEFVTQVNKIQHKKWCISHTLQNLCETRGPAGWHKATNQALKGCVNLVASQHPSDWESRVEQSLFEYRVGKHSTTQYSPFYLMFGREARL
uniref:Gypsy retrotransposon integrase-like protein 1 n=1 Tax=Petromyzon marinus TaxID=7757 RepID=S4RFX4_PETMA